MNTLRSLKFLEITGGGLRLYKGGDQSWYRKYFQRMAGCGPTAGANMAWYLTQAHEECRGLVPWDGSGREGFLKLMEEMWGFITPGLKGVHKTSMFAHGITGFARSRSVPLGVDTLSVPGERRERPSPARVADFCRAAIEKDLPIAYLNYDRGKVANLESWHWVTLVGIESGGATARIYDQGKQLLVDMALWLDTTRQGGGFVAAYPALKFSGVLSDI